MTTKALPSSDFWNRALETLLALILFMIGLFGLRLAHDTALWNQFFGGSGLADAIGEVVWQDGVVRRKPTGTVAWRDVPARNGVAVGDMIFTGEDGRASIILNQGGRFEIEPNSLIRIELQANSGDAGDWWPGAPRPEETLRIERGGGRYIAPTQEELDEEDAGEVVPNILSQAPRKITVVAAGKKVQLTESTAVTAQGDRQELGGRPLRNVWPSDRAQLRVGRVIVGGLKALPSVEFRWDGVAPKKDVNYQLVIEGTGGSRKIDLSTEEFKGNTWLERLEEGDYKWRLSPASGVGPSTSWTSFKLAVIQAPKQLAPGKDVIIRLGERKTTAHVGFLVSELPSELSFELEYQREGDDFRALFQSRTAGVPRIERDIAEGTYQWRVRSVSPRGERSDWSERMRFQIAPPPQTLAAVTPGPEPLPLPTEKTDAKAPSAGTVKIETLPTAEIARTKVAPTAPQAQPTQSPVKLEPEITVSGTAATTSTRLGDSLNVDMLPVALRWKPVKGASQYDVIVRDADGEIVKASKVSVPRFEMVINSITATEYTYRVTADLPDGRKALSSWLPIRIALAPPVPRRPANNSVQNLSAVLLTWESTILTNSYHLQISTRPDFGKIVYEKRLQKNLKLLQSQDLPGPGTYYWRVSGIVSNRESPWSTPYRFSATTTQLAGPKQAPPTSPARLPATQTQYEAPDL